MPLPITVYPDAEKAVIDYLLPLVTAYDPTVKVSVRGGGGHFIRVRRVGGVEATPAHDHPRVDLLIWHDSDKLRMALAAHVWAWLRALNNDPAGDSVLTYTGTLSGPQQVPDPADDTQALCLLTVELLARSSSS